MRILSLTYEYLPIGGGGSRVAAAINEELARRGDDVTVLTSAMKGLPDRERSAGVEIHRAPCIRRHHHYTTAAELMTTLWPAYRRGAELIERARPDVIHTHFVLPSGVVAWALSRRFRIPYVLTAHGSDVPGYNPDRFKFLHRLLSLSWRRILDDAAAVTSPSRFLARLMHRNGCRRAVTIVPNGHWPLARLGEARRHRILVVARMFPRKGIQHFIDAVAGMDNGWEMVIAGDGPYRAELEAKARRITPKVRFVGFVGPEALRMLYESSRILVFPSIQENFPMVLLEAMDAGCAVVTANAEGCAEVVGDAGIVVPKANPAGIRAALERLVADPALCDELASRGERRAASLSWQRIVPSYRAVLAAAAATGDALDRRLAVR